MKIPLISDIKRFSVHNGDGIRTTIFFKGCSLKCIWCHNPESIEAKAQLAYFENKCVSCGECTKACSNNAHKIADGLHIYDFNLCNSCGECAKVCSQGAMKIYGRSYTIDELTDILLSDKKYFDSSNGGVTFSGGECLLYSDFCSELAKQLKQHNIHIAVDTCGFVNKSDFDKIAPYTDLFLYDIKAIDRDTHIRCTGLPNDIILENLKYIDGFNIPIYIRIPYVPGYNDMEMDKIADFIKQLKNVKRVDVLAYHNYAASRYAALNIQNTLPETLPTDDEICKAQSKFNI